MRTTVNQDEMTALARAQADKLRVVRRAIKPVIGHAYVDSVPGHKVNRGSAPLWEMFALSTCSRSRFRGISCFTQSNPAISRLRSLITGCAADLAQAEDAVILLGPAARDLLKNTLHVTFDFENELEKQERLWRGEDEYKNQSILDSILGARKTLQKKGQYGEYYVIVSPQLYEEAYKPRAGTSPTDAPIYQILPLLANNGFLYSDALGGKSGVMFSLARGTISLSVPMDIWVDPSLSNDEEGRPRYKVGEQFRLVIDDTDARVDLR